MSVSPPQPPFVPLSFTRREPREMQIRAREFKELMALRRSVRHFAPDPVPDGVIEDCIATAASAPSGAHRQPWTFVVVRDAALKRRIRLAAEEEERKLYRERISDEWRAALAPLGTDEHKPFLEIAPALIVVFRRAHELSDGERRANYYTQESVGIASGMLLAALHNAGLASLTHTPSPMAFLQELLERPENERAFLLIPVGYPATNCVTPNLVRKPFHEVCVQL